MRVLWIVVAVLVWLVFLVLVVALCRAARVGDEMAARLRDADAGALGGDHGE